MRHHLLTSLLFGLSFLSCTKPAGNTQATATESTNAPISASANTSTTPQTAGTAECPNYFYYYNTEKISLKIKPHYIIAGFQKGTTPDSRLRILKQFPEYESVTAENTTDVAPFVVIKLKTGTTCNQTLPILAKLNQTTDVLFANPVFNAPATLGRETAWIGLTSEFLVNIKPGQLAQLNAMVASTKTKIVDELGETTFLLQATKTSQGNALEMANLFNEQPFVTNAEPDFFVAAQTGGLQKNK